MIKKALDFINEEIKGCIMNIKFCRDKGYDSPFHDQRLIDLNNLKEAYEKLLDKETPKRVIKFTSEITNSEEAYSFYTCPKCRMMLSNDIYCPKCGQALDWSDEDE